MSGMAEHKITYDRTKYRWLAEDGREVRLRWGYQDGFSIPVTGNPIKVEFTCRQVLYDIYLSHYPGQFFIKIPHKTLHDKSVYEFTIPGGHPCFEYFRKVFIRDDKEYERSLGHDDTWQLYGKDDGKPII